MENSSEIYKAKEIHSGLQDGISNIFQDNNNLPPDNHVDFINEESTSNNSEFKFVVKP